MSESVPYRGPTNHRLATILWVSMAPLVIRETVFRLSQVCSPEAPHLQAAIEWLGFYDESTDRAAELIASEGGFARTGDREL